MKILLLGQPSEEKYSKICPPLGLCYLSSMLKKEGFNAKIIDASSDSWRKIKKLLKKEKPDIVGVECLTIERGQTYKLAKIIRKELPKSIIVMGGQHASVFPEQMFKLAPIDFVVIGEGEITMLELAKALESNREDLSNIRGLAYKDKQNKIRINEKRELIENLDELPFPDYSTIDFNDYRFGEFKEPSAPIMTSRGCPYNCAFCSSTQFWGRKYRARSAKNVLDEIEKLYKEDGIKIFNFYDDNFIVLKPRLIEICQGIIDRGLKIKFATAGNVKIVDEERLKWLKKAGCISLGFGVESGSAEILKNINKPQNIEDIKKAFSLVRKYGLETGGSLIVGNPGETKKTIKETAKLMNEIVPERLSYAGILWILPGTPIYDLSKQQGIISDKTWLKTNKEIYYTGEYSLRQLKKFQRLLLYYQAKDRDFKQKLSFIIWYIHLKVPARIKRIFRYIYYSILRPNYFV